MVTISKEVPARIVFVRDRNCRSKWIAFVYVVLD
jgi:hypothetical protein